MRSFLGPPATLAVIFFEKNPDPLLLLRATHRSWPQMLAVKAGMRDERKREHKTLIPPSILKGIRADDWHGALGLFVTVSRVP